MERLEASLRREDKLLQLWDATVATIEKQEQLNENLEWQLGLSVEMYEATKEQLTLTEKTIKKGKRKNFVTGALIGVAAGFVTGVVLSN